jgi:hypothetical protein
MVSFDFLQAGPDGSTILDGWSGNFDLIEMGPAADDMLIDLRSNREPSTRCRRICGGSRLVVKLLNDVNRTPRIANGSGASAVEKSK